ncbi:MazG-like family protein [Staphylococcus equorum]|uniref:MazG-like family protein n=1 Tax=Staphylococcus equorum TaxID=246432 RepID=UPI0025525261|nr:MazG-like family protein [Staphylococcus equorum]MDK9853144.1 MazG-like family protein [Staphylococcus equorum]
MSKDLQEFTGLIEQWAEDRNLHTADPIKQYDKLIEEFGELMKGINKQDMPMIKDSIGDMYVVLVVMGRQIGLSMADLLKDESLDTLRPEHSTFGYVRDLNRLADNMKSNEFYDGYVFIWNASDIEKQLAKTCGEYEIAFVDCVELAYNEIKDRKGEMRDGKFVKSEDLQEADQ